MKSYTPFYSFCRAGIAYLLTWCLFISLQAQSLDSLKNVLVNVNPIEKRIDLLKQAGEGYLYTQPSDAIFFFEELVRIAEQKNDNILKAFALNQIGNCWYNQNKLGQSIQFYLEALAATEDDAAYDDLRSRINNNLGWSFKKLEEFEKALKYFKEAEQQARKTGVKKSLALILNNKGVTEKDLKQYDQALLSLNESLLINKEIGDKRQERFNLNNIAVIYIDQKKYDQAKENLLQLTQINKTLGDTVELMNNYQNLGQTYIGLKDEQLAESYFLAAINLAKLQRNVDMESNVLAEISKMYRRQGNFEKSLRYSDMFYSLSDSLQKQETKRFAIELESKYNAVVKERELEKTNKALAEQKLYATWIVGALALTIIGILIIVRVLIIKRKNERKLVALNNEIEAQAEELRQANEEINAINENLEEILAKRTKVIIEQNERLKQFAFVNAHKIRGPVATILGLINIIEITNDDKTKEELLKHLHTSSLKLDMVIREVSKQLDNGSNEETNM
jgi:tetratricopeptide (TPR) repeat protein